MRRLVAVMGVLAGMSLLLAGFGGGVAGGLAMGWASWLWGRDPLGMVLGALLVVAVLAVLFFAGRLAAYGMASRAGAAAFGVGWAIAMLVMTGYTPGDSIVFTADLLTYAFLFGGLLAVTIATVTAPQGTSSTRTSRPPGPVPAAVG